MKKDIFDRAVFEPGDKQSTLKRRLGPGPYVVVVAHVPGDHTWSAQVRSERGESIDLQGFESDTEILLWLNKLDWSDVKVHGPGPDRAAALESDAPPPSES